MSDNDELRIEPPKGWRKLEPSEEMKSGDLVLRNWKWERVFTDWIGEPTVDSIAIRRIEPEQPETCETAVHILRNELTVINPNNEVAISPRFAPCVVGPIWQFSGFMWNGISCPANSYYSINGDDKVEYARAVLWRRVKEESK